MYNRADLANMTTQQLRDLLANYQSQRQGLPRQHRTRTSNFVTDTRRVNEAIRGINDELRSRSRRQRPLKEFAN